MRKRNDMRKLFMPDLMLDHFYELTPILLKQYNVRAVVADIDNTLAPYEEAEPSEKVKGWVRTLAENDIKLALISNNNEERVSLFNKDLGLPAYPNSGKPSLRCFYAALSALSAKPGESAVIGDQLFTDVAAARRMGMKAFLVPPIRDKKTLFFRFKRLLERPFIRAYRHKAEKTKHE